MEHYQDVALVVAGGLLLLILAGLLLWRGLGKPPGIPPVSEQWLAERRGKRPPE
jgi:hypothetical protein